jgi:hypothetical protein
VKITSLKVDYCLTMNGRPPMPVTVGEGGFRFW